VRLSENFNISFIGDTKKGKFDIPNELAQEMIKTTGNPNGQPNSNVIKLGSTV
jgi:hypothetical protein